MRTSQKSITEVCRILICSLEARAANRSVLRGADALLRMIGETCFSTISKSLKSSGPSILLLKMFPICLVYRRGNVSESSLKRFQNWGIVYLEGNIAWLHTEDAIRQRERLKAERIAAREQRVEPVRDVQPINGNVSNEISEPTESECEEVLEYEDYEQEESFEMSM